MTVGGLNPNVSFGNLTGTTRTGKAFQTQDMSMISLLNSSPQAGGSEGINDSNKGEYLALFENMQGAQEAGPKQGGLKGIYNNLVNHFVRSKLS